MKNVKKILGVILAMCFLMAFATGCNKVEEGGSEPVDTGVQKDKTTAILVVSFGTSYNDSREKTIGAVENAIAKAYPQYEVRRAFTSQIIIDKLKERDNLSIDNVQEALDRAVADGIKTLIVQPTHLMDGYEYNDLKEELTNYEGRFDAIKLGAPLLTSDEDFDKVIDAITKDTESFNDGKTLVAFMGHGNPVGYDYYGGNVRYLQLESYLRALNPNYYVGTVDMAETYAADVLNHIDGGNFNYSVGAMPVGVNYEKNTSKAAQLFVLMSIAGDHAHNDMADDEDAESWYSLFNAKGIATNAYETNFKEACWKKYKSGEEYIPGLAERSAVRKLWMDHTRQAIAKLGTDDALSTPTTAPEE